MKQQRILPAFLGLLAAVVFAASPMLAHADTVPLPISSPVLISEIQPGSAASASEEFIELYNTTALPIDFGAHAWQLELASTTATSWSAPLRTITLSGVIAPGQSYVVASQYTSGGQTVQYLPGVAQVWFGAGISAAGGHVRLSYSSNQLQSDGTCSASQTVVDEVEWSAPKSGAPGTASLDGRSVFVTPKSSGVAAGNSLQRLVDSGTQQYVDTDNDAADFAIGIAPTPAAGNVLSAVAPAGAPQDPVPLPADTCDPGATAPGDTDGSPPTADPGSDPTQQDGADASGAGGQDTAAIPAADQGLLAPQISELLPNPEAPQTDAADEFVELYNPNEAAFDLSEFTLQAGATTTHTYTFPAGTVLAPKAFTAFFSSTTGLSLANSGGQVSLLDPAGNVIIRSDVYPAAKDGQAWIFANGIWQWTTSPTPGAANIVAPPDKAAGTKTTATTKTVAAKKTTAVKAATTKAKTTKTKAKATAKKKAPVQTLVANTAAPQSSLHPGILAGIGVLAVLYGAYEYRHYMANRFRHLRGNRAARRKAGQTAARR